MFSWMGDVQVARKLILKASKRFKVKVIEGGYKPKERVFRMKKFDYAKVKKGDKTIGQNRVYCIKIWKWSLGNT